MEKNILFIIKYLFLKIVSIKEKHYSKVKKCFFNLNESVMITKLNQMKFDTYTEISNR